MNDNTDTKLDRIIELLEKIEANTNPLNPWNEDGAIKSAVEEIEAESKKIRSHLTGETE